MSDAPRQFGAETQDAICLRGLRGATLDVQTNFIGLAREAQKTTSPEAWARKQISAAKCSARVLRRRPSRARSALVWRFNQPTIIVSVIASDERDRVR